MARSLIGPLGFILVFTSAMHSEQDVHGVVLHTKRVVDRVNASVRRDHLYISHHRFRHETTVMFPTTQTTAPGVVTIFDGRRLILLHELHKTFSEESPDLHVKAARLSAEPDPFGQMGTESTDTGERRSYGGITARRMVTRISGPHFMETHDGWYLELSDSGRHVGGAVDFAALTGQERTAGLAFWGYPVDVVVNRRGSDSSLTTTISLEHVRAGPISAARFALPEGFRRALPLPFGGVDFRRPDSATNRVRSYAEVVLELFGLGAHRR